MTRRDDLIKLRIVVGHLRELYEAEKALTDACVDGDPDIKARRASTATARDCLIIAMAALVAAQEPAIIAQEGGE
jgi:hypothetical protein